MTQADSVHSTPRITAPKTNPTTDEIGMAWWNSLSKQERAKWSAIAGNTGRPTDAWDAFRRGSIDQSPPIDPTRRRFLSTAVGVAAGSAVLALGTIPPSLAVAAPVGLADPAFGLIEAHRTAHAAHLVALAEQSRLEEIGDPAADEVVDAPCQAARAAFEELIDTAPTTFAGLRAWASYLDELRGVEEWMFEEEGPALVVTLAEALGNLAVTT